MLGLSPDAGRGLIAHAVELAHRLPLTWERVMAGTLSAWKARRIAESTLALSIDGAAFVDRQVAFSAHKVGPAQLQRLVDEAIARFEPALADEQRRAAADRRHLTIDHRQVSFDGTCQVTGELDLPDAQDLDAALTAEAARLKELGCEEPLDVRRALAIGALARRDLALDLDLALDRDLEPTVNLHDDIAAEETESDAPAEPTTSTRASRPEGRRDVVLYVHLSHDALGRHLGTGHLENHGPALITADTIRDWLSVDGTRISVRPVSTSTSTRWRPAI